MKLLSTIAALTAAISTATAAPAQPDTIKVIDNPASVTVVSNGDRKLHLKVKSEGSDYDFLAENLDSGREPVIDIDMPFLRDNDASATSRRRNRRAAWRAFSVRGAYVGASMPSDAVKGIRTSWEWGISQIAGAELRSPSRRTALTAGVGFFHRMQKVGGGYHIEDGGNGRIFLAPDGEGMRSVSSSVSSFGLQLPVMPKQQLVGPTGMAIGVVGMWNTYTRASTKWTDPDGTSCRRKYKGLYQRAFSVDGLVILNFGSEIGWYARYSPFRMFHRSTGPEYSLWSTGLNIGF